eukprot:00380_4
MGKYQSECCSFPQKKIPYILYRIENLEVDATSDVASMPCDMDLTRSSVFTVRHEEIETAS